jgi:hypothetical protein
MIENSKKFKNIRNATPTIYFSFTQSLINLEEDDVVFDDNNNMKRLRGRKVTKKQAKKDKGSISSHIRSILED